MPETDSSPDASVVHQTYPPETDLHAEHELTGHELAEHDVTGQDDHAVTADPVLPVTPAPVPSATQDSEGVAIKEVFQMVGAMVFVFCFAALGFNAMYHAGY
ncbi:hypothetical protein [Acetobacter orleanensis]|uniref:Uncharacterized protein n=1 Tax=Acetobacter orleanensis TaxID=104099 RepID=A0A4Y3TNM5_9PROT|nr:hypothetical protein [Acetobacter orleanensis]KXV62333.1 hypothetical protein AD949_11255 [Acetobacter orleanensis]PCD79448.1 hypothetical protein CO710_07355 [Acetobacter orleanensis]GAN67560.1 hypothetical protein Abol_009_006 [Acetobacter orleanensis JCM 7639]GBR25476.1 hypothetical protein AA0473_0905 [Acetobacter orleanensis NRIC 0473]GEB82580.1 hypothetical protein AOR01nite_10570 [Acetobacter orleanensis]